MLPNASNIQQWIEDNKESLKPPVGNKVMTANDDFIIMVVGGPNKRFDFHHEPYAEWFYQLKGDIWVTIIEDGKRRRVHIKEGETWMLPPNTPHSPTRPNEGSVGLVVERMRPAGVKEYFQWYCPECDNKVHEIEVTVGDIEGDLPNVYKQFGFLSDEERTCNKCGHIHPAEPDGPEMYDGKRPKAVES